MNADEKLAGILRAEADTVAPGPEGWDAIRAGIAARRRRTAWLRGGLVATAALSLVAVAVVVRLDAGRDRSLDVTNSPTPTPVAPVVTYVKAVWPFTSSAQVEDWKTTHQPDLSAPHTVAEMFAKTYLGIPNPTVVATGTRYEIRRTIEGTSQQTLVTSATLEQFGGTGGPWLVTSAGTDAVQFGPVGALRSPLTMRGTYHSVDPRFTVELRGEPDAAGVAPVLAKATATTAPPSNWTATLQFRGLSGRGGSLLVTEASLADTGIASAAAIPLEFGGQAPPTSMPGFFVAMDGNRMTVFSTATGARLRELPIGTPGGDVSNVRLSADGETVTYVVSTGTCSSVGRALKLSDGTQVSLPPTGGSSPGHVGSMSYDPTSGALAYTFTVCGAPADAVDLVWYDGATQHTTRLAVQPRSPIQQHTNWAVYAGVDGKLYGIPTTPHEIETVAAPEPGCAWTTVTPQRADGLLTGAEQCADGARLVVLDQRLARLTTLKQLDAIAVQALDYDASGDWLLIWRGGASVTGPIEALGPDGSLKQIAQGPTSPSW